MATHKKFTKKIAKAIANNSICLVLDSVLGISDTNYDLSSNGNDFEQNFEEDLQELGFNPSEKRIGICREEFDKIMLLIKRPIQPYYKHKI